MDTDQIKQNLKDKQGWQRGFFTLLFVVIFSVTEFVMYTIAIFQIFSCLITTKPNQNLLNFSSGLSRYIAEVAAYILFQSEDKPFPFREWPKS